jgi:hypothetical protein
MNYYQDVVKPLEQALIGRSFAWFGSGVRDTGGGCQAFVIECGDSEDATQPSLYIMVTDEDTPFLETTGPYTVGIYDRFDDMLCEYVTAPDARTAIDTAERLVLEVTAS